MSEQQTEPQTIPSEGTVAQGSGNTASVPASPATEVVAPAQNSAGGRVAVPPEKGSDPGTPLGKNAPPLEDLQHAPCPNCTVGVLYVTRYDPLALHEQGQDVWIQNQPRALAPGFESGGAYDVRCFNCEWSHSFPLNPGERYGQPRA